MSALASWIEYGRGGEYKPALYKQWLNEARGRWPIIDRRKEGHDTQGNTG